jgi:hypothetical protein
MKANQFETLMEIHAAFQKAVDNGSLDELSKSVDKKIIDQVRDAVFDLVTKQYFKHRGKNG